MSTHPVPAERVAWTLGILSGAVIVGLMGYLVYTGLDAEAPPDLAAELVAPPGTRSTDHVRFVVRNDGGKTATAVALSLTLRDPGGAVVDVRRLILDYLPGHSEATGGFLLPAGTDTRRMEITVEGYLDP